MNHNKEQIMQGTRHNKKQQAHEYSIYFAVFVPDEQSLCVAFRVANNATIQYTHIITKFIVFSQPISSSIFATRRQSSLSSNQYSFERAQYITKL
jgi:hypothetical protein